MNAPTSALGAIPLGLRGPLLAEHASLTQAFLEHRWSPAGISGGKFCEIVYTIIDGYGAGKYESKPKKPRDMIAACKALEQRTTVPRSFQILIPRMIPPLYEVRNNRGSGHAGGEVDPNHMDTVVVLAMVSWIMAELVRVLHSTSTQEAQLVVDSLASRRTPLVWEGGKTRRVLDTSLGLEEQILLLVGTSPNGAKPVEVFEHTGRTDRGYFNKVLRKMHSARSVELSADETHVMILPPGTARLEAVVLAHVDSQMRQPTSGRRRRPR